MPDKHKNIEDELRRMNFQLEQALEAANAAIEAKTSFLSNMSHDIRTPMNAIIGMTSIAQKHLDEKARVQDCLNKIQVASAHLMSLINNVLDMSRIESGRVTISEEQFSLADLVHDLSVLLRPLATAKKQRLTFDVSEIDHEALMGDVLYLRQVFVNIINNAIKYTPEEGDVRVTFSQLEGDDPLTTVLVFRCEDNGIGMSDDFLTRIFIPFEREKNTTMSRVEGTGLGMAITRSLVQQMGGEIRVHSVLGEGSTFTVTLPMSLADSNYPRLDGKRVLVIEPEDAQRALITRTLTSGGAEPSEVSSGTAAVAWIGQSQMENTPPDAVLIGGGMSESAEFDLAIYLRGQLGEDVPILLVNEQDWGSIEYSALRAGITGFVPCPLFKGRLLRALADSTVSDDSLADSIDFHGMKVLLVEDNELNREIASELIAETGAQVDSAEDGSVAVEKFSASPVGYYDLVLMDIQMPVMNGYEATTTIRALQREDAATVCIAAMTANAFVEDIKRTRAAGMDEHLSKPVEVKNLQALMRRCYHRRAD